MLLEGHSKDIFRTCSQQAWSSHFFNGLKDWLLAEHPIWRNRTKFLGCCTHIVVGDWTDVLLLVFGHSLLHSLLHSGAQSIHGCLRKSTALLKFTERQSCVNRKCVEIYDKTYSKKCMITSMHFSLLRIALFIFSIMISNFLRSTWLVICTLKRVSLNAQYNGS